MWHYQLHFTEEELEAQRSPLYPPLLLLPQIPNILVLKGALLPACEWQSEFQFQAVREARQVFGPSEPLKGPSQWLKPKGLLRLLLHPGLLSY